TSPSAISRRSQGWEPCPRSAQPWICAHVRWARPVAVPGLFFGWCRPEESGSISYPGSIAPWNVLLSALKQSIVDGLPDHLPLCVTVCDNTAEATWEPVEALD